VTLAHMILWLVRAFDLPNFDRHGYFRVPAAGEIHKFLPYCRRAYQLEYLELLALVVFQLDALFHGFEHSRRSLAIDAKEGSKTAPNTHADGYPLAFLFASEAGMGRFVSSRWGIRRHTSLPRVTRPLICHVLGGDNLHNICRMERAESRVPLATPRFLLHSGVYNPNERRKCGIGRDGTSWMKWVCQTLGG